ncbi:hypothetical protein EX30DRAFT_367765 [Ascodesmis nigricans]|uniref:Uncharacterized protein n=1 Tax=Ascodesmis nigricans TaxID=341454 RepID=A0A4S2N5U4_9PEZI|nr:hypothetical protein EX30DRAFT_367765 [Ascodesmis nigricans]
MKSSLILLITGISTALAVPSHITVRVSDDDGDQAPLKCTYPSNWQNEECRCVGFKDRDNFQTPWWGICHVMVYPRPLACMPCKGSDEDKGDDQVRKMRVDDREPSDEECRIGYFNPKCCGRGFKDGGDPFSPESPFFRTCLLRVYPNFPCMKNCPRDLEEHKAGMLDL